MWNENYHEKEFSYLAAIEKGRKLPDWVEEEPYLEPGEEWILSAYFDLSTGRGMDGSIPWRDMVMYAEYAGLEEDVARGFIQILRIVDAERLQRQQAKNKGSDYEAPSQAENSPAMAAASKDEMMAAARRRAASGKKGK